MATEFYNSIPEGIREKLQEYSEYSHKRDNIEMQEFSSFEKLTQMFIFYGTEEGFDFWYEHHSNNTFPIWSEEQNRFINP